MNKVALGTVIGAALLGLTKSKSGGRSVKSKFIQNKSHFKRLDSKQEAIPELLIFSTLIPRDLDISVYGAGEFNKTIKKMPNAESIFVEEVRNKGEPDFRKAKNLKHLAIRGSFKELRPERFTGLNKLESLAIFSEKMEFIPDFLKDIPNLKMLYIAAPIASLLPLKGMTQLTFLKVNTDDPLLDLGGNKKERYYGNSTLSEFTLRTLTSLEYLYLNDRRCYFSDSSQLEVFQNMKNLKQLYIKQERQLNMHNDGGYEYLSSCKNLEFLCLFNTQFHVYQGISLTEELGRLPKLKYLLLPFDEGSWGDNHNYMTINDKNLPKLEYLWISHLENITFEGKFKSLETLCFEPYSTKYHIPNLKQAHGLQNLSALKNAFITGSRNQSYVVEMMNQLFLIRSIENIYLCSSYMNLDFYSSKISCTKLKTLNLMLNTCDVAIPRDIKKCKDLESIYIPDPYGKVAFNKSLLRLPSLKKFHGNHLVLYNPRVDSIGECTKVPVELMYDSNISFSGERTNIDISSLNPAFVYKIFSENTLHIGFKSGDTTVSFGGMSIKEGETVYSFSIQKFIPFEFIFSKGDAEIIPKLPISFDHQSIKELSERKTSLWGKEGKKPLTLKFNYPTPIVTKIIQPKYLNQSTISLQQWKQSHLPQQQYFSKGFDKKYKENPLYVPYSILSFDRSFDLGSPMWEMQDYFDPELYVKPFAEDIFGLHIYNSLPFKTIGSISFPKLTTLVINIPQYGTKEISQDVFNLLEEIFNAAPNLSVIYIEGSNVKSIPDNIGSLTKLSTLVIQDTTITDLPLSMKNNKKLYTLDLSNNQIRSFPMVLSDLQFSVARFRISGNPLDQNENLGRLFILTRNNVQRKLEDRTLTAYQREHYDNLRYPHKNPILNAITRKIKYPSYSEVSRIRKR